MNTKGKTSSKTVKKLVDEVRPQVTALEKKYKLTRPQRITVYNALIEILQRKTDRPHITKLNKMRGAAGERAREFMEVFAGVIVNAVNARKAARESLKKTMPMKEWDW